MSFRTHPRSWWHRPRHTSALSAPVRLAVDSDGEVLAQEQRLECKEPSLELDRGGSKSRRTERRMLHILDGMGKGTISTCHPIGWASIWSSGLAPSNSRRRHVLSPALLSTSGK